jgi:hypothetical protein
MQAAIGNMIKNGLKNISDETARAYLEHLAGLGEIQVGGEIMTGSALMRDYDEFAKQEFKDAGKAVTKGEKKKQQKSGGGGENKQKRTKSAYLLFCEATRPELKKEGLSFPETAKRLGELWGDKETKAKYEAIARKLKEDSGGAGGAAGSAGDTKKPAQREKTIAVKPAVEAKAGSGKTDAMGVKYATAAAQRFAQDNNIDGGLAKYGGNATGKDGAFKLADLKKIVDEIAANAEEEEVEEEEVDEDEEVDEEEDEEVEEEDTDPSEWVGWTCRVWNDDEDDWEYGEITKYNSKKSLHTVKFNDSGKTREIDIKKLEEEEHFEWDD